MKRMLAVLLVSVGSACTFVADAPPSPPAPAGGGDGTGTIVGATEGLGSEWLPISYGVAFQQVNAGSAVLIAYGGYTAELSYSAAWATELVDAALGAQGVGRIYAVQGPADPSYSGKEIGNSELRAHLATIDDGVSPIYVVAHSSGTYVAHEMLGQYEDAGTTTVLDRMGYANLDGGGTGLDTFIVTTLRAMTFTYAYDPTLSDGYSENYETGISLGQEYAPKATTYEVTVPDTGCDDGAGWCMHDVLITHRPHDPETFDLADDYTDFVNRPPTIEYLPTLMPM
jgi:hypothetical protein